ATVGAVIGEHAIRRADVLALMTVTAGALADREIAPLAEIIAPRIGEIHRGGLVEHQRNIVDLATIGRTLAADPSNVTASITVAPRHEGLRFHIGGRVRDGKAHVRIDVIVDASRHLLPAAVLDEIPGTVVGE